MCRNITRLFPLDPPANRAEIQAAAQQYVRKISGMTRPGRANAAAWEAAVAAVAAASAELLAALTTTAPPQPRPPALLHLARGEDALPPTPVLGGEGQE
jgi:hypothetical protein